MIARSFALVLTLAAALTLTAPSAGAQDVLVEKSEIRFVAKQLGVNVEGRFRKWKANVVFLPADLAKSKAEFDIDLASVDLASEDSEKEIRDRLWFDTAKFPVAHFASTSSVLDREEKTAMLKLSIAVGQPDREKSCPRTRPASRPSRARAPAVALGH